jgi:hypothetical protein
LIVRRALYSKSLPTWMSFIGGTPTCARPDESVVTGCPGSEYESIIARSPLRMTAGSELVEVELDRKVVYEGSIAWFWSVDSLAFEASGDGTRITFRNETSTPRWLSPLIPLLNAAFQRQARRAVEGAPRSTWPTLPRINSSHTAPITLSDPDGATTQRPRPTTRRPRNPPRITHISSHMRLGVAHK